MNTVNGSNIKFRVTLIIENVNDEMEAFEGYHLGKLVMGIGNLKRAISQLFNDSLKYIHQDIEGDCNDEVDCSKMTS